MAEVILVSTPENLKEQTFFTIHLATFLAYLNKTALVDFLPETKVMENFVAKRHYYNLKNNRNLPVPTYFENTKNLLSKIRSGFDFVVLDDVNGTLFECADIVLMLITDEKSVDLITDKNSPLSKTLWQAKINRAKTGKNAFKHVLIGGDFLSEEHIQKLKQNASLMGYVFVPHFAFGEIYKAFLKDGITFLDKDMPYLMKSFNQDDFFARRDLKRILEFIWSDK